MRPSLAALLCALALSLFSGCSGESLDAASAAQRKILLVNNKDDPRWLDLHRTNSVVENNIMLAIHEGLVVEGKDNERFPDPGIAERWESNPDKSVWTFHLRQNARWSDGTPITPDDFIWSWQRLLNPK
ncbi:MAG: ABC transporter substrate-binding protein, partial [Verrucomicrobiota bacterium]